MFHLNRPGSKLSRQSIADVQQALYLLVATRKGEIPYQPNYGLSLVYEVLGGLEDYREAIEQEVVSAIVQFEPRIAVVAVEATPELTKGKRSITLKVNFIFETVAGLFSTNLPLRS